MQNARDCRESITNKHQAQSDAKCTRLQGEHQKYEGMHEAAGRASKKCNKASKSN
jgi:hypothetical protein